jgi:hypothetical protein
MYYQSVSHKSVPVSSAQEAARRIKSGREMSFHALIWKNSTGQRIAAVDDGGLDDSWGEVAVINIDTDRQLESITFPWCSDEEAARYLMECQDSAGLSNRPANLPLDGAGEDKPAAFTCGCCGDGFTSTIAEQRPHDQDEGYGYCPRCISDYIAA